MYELIYRDKLIKDLLEVRYKEINTIPKLIKFIEKQQTIELPTTAVFNNIKTTLLSNKINTIKVYPDGSDVPKTFYVERRGRWVKEKNRRNHWHCSKCKYVIGVMKMDANYCPYCGARMESE